MPVVSSARGRRSADIINLRGAACHGRGGGEKWWKLQESEVEEDKQGRQNQGGVPQREGVASLGGPSYLSVPGQKTSTSPAALLPLFALPVCPAVRTMVDRISDSEGASRAKRQKMTKTDVDPRDNPYLAHMYEPAADANEWVDGAIDKAFRKMKRRQTTAADAKRVEDGGVNPFSKEPFSPKYYSILKDRRDLPVHAQR